MIKKLFKSIVSYVKEEYKFLIVSLIIYIILLLPVNYYITIGGGISDIDSRVEVENAYDVEGSFNISYVEQVRDKVATYLLSYIVPDWEKESLDLYKNDTNESIEDIEFRSDMDLKKANDVAIMWAYKLANKDIEITDTHIYVSTVYKEYNNPIKVKDEILSINGYKYNNVMEYVNYLQTLDINDEVLIKVKRNGKEKELKCKLYEYEDSKILGLSLYLVNEYKTDPKVELKFPKDESGPSGGLITTLAIYNKLIEEDITKGLKIAGTGTIDEDGTIGEIGGVKYKLMGASKKKADVFLVPAGRNYEECLALKEEKNLKIKLISVSNINEAIEKLKEL